MFQKKQKLGLAGTLLVAAIHGALAQPVPAAPPSPVTLKQAFDSAWARQPEALSQEFRREAAVARRQSADSWTAEPPALELSSKTDQLNSNRGIREHAAGIAIPLWLPGERSRTGALADAELRATTSHVKAAQLRTAASIRETYWQWQRARVEMDLAQARLDNANKLASDVAKRVRAGDLARADQHQAEGTLAAAEAALAESKGALAAAEQRLRALTGTTPDTYSGNESIPMEKAPAELDTSVERHPLGESLQDRAEVARRSAELAGVQTRANPELTLSTTRERDLLSDPYQQSITVGVRIPFGSDSRNKAKVASARAEAMEAEAQLALERDRLASELEAAKVRVDSARMRQAAAQKRSQLAGESRGFFEKSFRLGETDLPTMLRIELETYEAQRQAALARIELATALSAWRQALGLLPE